MNKITIDSTTIEWDSKTGTCTFNGIPAVSMWVNSTYHHIMKSIVEMVGVERFLYSQQKQGRDSVEDDWVEISKYKDFGMGVEEHSKLAAIGGWGVMRLVKIDQISKQAIFRIHNGVEGRSQQSAGVCWGSGIIAGKVAGFCEKLFNCNCWPEQTKFIANGDDYDEFLVTESHKTFEKELSKLIHADLATVNDITTAFKNLENEIQHRIQIEQAQKTLQRSQKMDAIGQLTGGIAHDLNNILAIILGNVQLLERHAIADENILKRINGIKQSTQRATNLTQQLLGFSRDHPRDIVHTEINKEFIQLNELIARSITPEVKVSYEFDEGLWPVKINSGDFHDAIINLTINARDAMPHGGKLVFQSQNYTSNSDDAINNLALSSGDYILLTVQDTGEGISTEKQERIFEPFFTTKPQGKGTGLGLSMVFGFVKRSNGHINVKSELNVGTIFQIYLPRSYDKEIITNVEDQEPEILPEGLETILVVDDEESLLELSKETLEALGYKVLTAPSSKQALKLLAAESDIDLLLSDVLMPGSMNGFELAQHATTSHPKLKVLLASGFTSIDKIAEDQKHFSKNMLTKPYTFSELAQRIRMVLNKPMFNNHTT